MKLLKREDLINLIIKALNFPKKKYKNTASLNSFEDWDSIGHLNIMLQLDQKLSGKAKNIKELADAHTVEKIERILKKKNC